MRRFSAEPPQQGTSCPMDDDEVASPILSPPEIAAIDALGKRRAVSGGDYLYREGAAKYDFYVIVSRAVEIVVQADGTERLAAPSGPVRTPSVRKPPPGTPTHVSA